MTGTPEAAAIAAGLELVKLGSGNTRLRATGDNIAYVGETLTGLVKTALMPLAVVNARAQAYFESKFPTDLAEKMQDVPQENIVSPRPSVAGPVLQGLGYSHEEQSLRDLYLGLLATAMDDRVADHAHPGFAEIIGALSANEVAYLEIFLRRDALAIAELRMATAGSEGWHVKYRHLLSITVNGTPDVNEMLPAYVDNWIRLGLVEVSYMNYLTAENSYGWVEQRPEYKQIMLGEGQTVAIEKGMIRRTAFGQEFGKAVGVL